MLEIKHGLAMTGPQPYAKGCSEMEMEIEMDTI